MKKIVLLSSVLSVLFAAGCQVETVTNAASVQNMPVNEIKFKDIRDHWAEASVQTAVKKKYVDGYDDGTFRPEENVSRAKFIKMVVTATKLATTSAAASDPWYKPYIDEATNVNILRTADFEDKDINEEFVLEQMDAGKLGAFNAKYVEALRYTVLSISNASSM